MTSSSPIVVLEVGNSESLTQLRINSKLWLESDYMHGVTTFFWVSFSAHQDLQIWLVIILSVTHPNITIKLWRGFNPVNLPCSQAACQRIVPMVWQADWTNNKTPLHILLSNGRHLCHNMITMTRWIWILYLGGSAFLIHGTSLKSVTFSPLLYICIHIIHFLPLVCQLNPFKNFSFFDLV